MTDKERFASDRARRNRVADRAEEARGLIRQALSWKTDGDAVTVMAKMLIECRDARMLAAVWRELSFIDSRTPYGLRAGRVVRQANDALARDMVRREGTKP